MTGIPGLSHASQAAQLHGLQHEPKTTGSASTASKMPVPKDSAEISDEAKQLLADETHGRQANPKAVAEELGYNNFGQLVKALRQSENKADVSISDLVHQNKEAIGQAQAFLTPQEAPESTGALEVSFEESLVVIPEADGTGPTDSLEQATENIALTDFLDTQPPDSDPTGSLLEDILTNTDQIEQ